ncbi:MAG: FHA domain-containing protein [Limnothrix sp.]
MQDLVIVRQLATGGTSAPLLPELRLVAGEECVIGREPSCQLALDAHLYTIVSRRHAVMRSPGQGWEIEDLGSANGTYVNGKLAVLKG